MSSIFFSSGIFTWQSKNMEKLSPNRAQLFLRNNNTVFTMGGTVALRPANKKFSGEQQFCSYLETSSQLIVQGLWLTER